MADSCLYFPNLGSYENGKDMFFIQSWWKYTIQIIQIENFTTLSEIHYLRDIELH